jgi:hypothetical protein
VFLSDFLDFRDSEVLLKYFINVEAIVIEVLRLGSWGFVECKDLLWFYVVGVFGESVHILFEFFGNFVWL